MTEVNASQTIVFQTLLDADLGIRIAGDFSKQGLGYSLQPHSETPSIHVTAPDGALINQFDSRMQVEGVHFVTVNL
jgi:hypothetical protein